MGIETLKQKKKIVALTCYDFSTAKIIDGIVDIILVGDSLGMVFQGKKDTKEVTMSQMLYHVAAVARGIQQSHVCADMPLHSYDTEELALKNAKAFLDAGAHSVKVEGAKISIAKRLVQEGIPVMGHLGLLPQTAEKYSVQGKDEKTAKKMLDDALALEKTGCYALVLECVPANLAKTITEKLKIPTIGIGAGKYCRGQVLVINDMLGLFNELKPKFVRRYANLDSEIKKAVQHYADDIVSGKFPSEEESFK